MHCARCDTLHEEGGPANAGDSNGSSNAMRYTSTHHHRQDTDAESCSIKRRRTETSSIERRATLSLTNRERQIQVFESPRCILYKGRNHSHEDHVADGGFHSWHITIWYTLTCRSAKPRTNRSVKIASEGIILKSNKERLGKVPSLDPFLFSMCRRHEHGWANSQLSSKATDHSYVFGMHAM